MKELNNKYQKSNLKIFPYNKPKTSLTVPEFYAYCEQFKPIILKED